MPHREMYGRVTGLTRPVSTSSNPGESIPLVGLRAGDTVTFIDPEGPAPTPESWNRHDLDGEPRSGDDGDVIEVGESTARVKWRFGATTDTPLRYLFRHRGNLGTHPHRYQVKFELVPARAGSVSDTQVDDVSYSVVTRGGAPKAVFMATLRCKHDVGDDFRVWSVEVEDEGTDFEPNPANDLIDYYEIA